VHRQTERQSSRGQQQTGGMKGTIGLVPSILRHARSSCGRNLPKLDVGRKLSTLAIMSQESLSQNHLLAPVHDWASRPGNLMFIRHRSGRARPTTYHPAMEGFEKMYGKNADAEEDEEEEDNLDDDFGGEDDRMEDDLPSFVGQDVPLSQIYEEEYCHIGKGGKKKQKKPLNETRGWVPGKTFEGIDTLIDFEREPWSAYDKMEEAEKSLSTVLPARDLTPQEFWHAAGYSMWYLYDDRVVQMTAKGKMQSFRALVTVGNGNGTAGYGIGKADTVPKAYDRALMDARKNLIYLELCQGKTLWEPLCGKWNNTKVIMKPAAAGRFTCSDWVLAVADCFGITQISSKIFGRKNPYIVIKAIFDAFQQFRTLEDMALVRGKPMYEVFAQTPRGGANAYTRT